MRTTFNWFILLLFSCLVLNACKDNSSKDAMRSLTNFDQSSEYLLNYLNQAVDDDPKDDFFRYKRALLYKEISRYKEAIQDIQVALAKRPNKSEYHLLLAELYYIDNNHFASIKAAEKAERLGEVSPELTVLQTKLFWVVGDTTGFNRYFSKATYMVPFHSDIHLVKAWKSLASKDTSEALIHLKTSLKSNRKNIEAYSSIVTIYLTKGNYDSTLFYVVQAKEVSAKIPAFIYAEAKAYSAVDLDQSALFTYQKCLSIDSLYFPALLEVGSYYYKNKQHPQAIDAFARYARYKENQDVYRTLITLYALQGNEIASIPYYEKLIRLDSLSVTLKYNLQKIYTKSAKETIVVDLSQTKTNTVTTKDSTVRVRRKSIKDSSSVSQPVKIDSMKARAKDVILPKDSL